MRTLTLCIMLLLAGWITAQSVDNPPFKSRTESIFNISRIERTPEATKLFIHAIFRPHWWIKVSGNSYLQDVATGKDYSFVKAEGIELNKETYMPDSGTMDFVLYYAPLPKETSGIHLLTPGNSDWKIYDISLNVPKRKNLPPIQLFKGNWYRADAPDKWECGVYDSICIINNRIFTNEHVNRKGKQIELSVKDKRDGHVETLLFTPQKNGTCFIQREGVRQLCTKERGNGMSIEAEKGFSRFFHRDSAYLQGYINGYDPRLKFETGLIYLNNAITREDYPTVINIHPDGTFDAKFLLNHPVENHINIKDCFIPFYIEPGQTLTVYIDWEDILARSRARDHNFPIKHTEYMGPSSTLSLMYNELQKLFTYPYTQLSKAQKELTPKQFSEQMQPVFAKWNVIGDSLAQAYEPSAKAMQLIRNKIALRKGGTLFEFLMGRDYYAEQDTANQALKVKEESSYYDFLKTVSLNDTTMLADNTCDIFFNRFEYMNPLKNAIYKPIILSDSVTTTYPAKSLFTFMKENGVQLSAEQEELRLEEEKLAGKTLKVSSKMLSRKFGLILPLIQAEKKLADEYEKKYEKRSSNETPSKPSEKQLDQWRLGDDNDYCAKGDTAINLITGQPHNFFWQTSLVRRLKFGLKQYKSREGAEMYINDLCKYLTFPVLAAESKRMLDVAHPINNAASYQLPECKGSDIFRNIIKDHQGKVLFVDFWATSCGPCRGGIEATDDLRKKYKDHPEFRFIYITDQRSSPQDAYDKYVEKNLKGEASYRVTEAEFYHLRELFKFNGIPHYELVEKDGSISTDSPDTWNLNEYLNKRFGGEDANERRQ